ncbi:MAG: HAD hydrolase-like protein, partial [Propionibacteriaceae bacterium]|nr:HAD hydrolase-like protein [Propionibacteriaceae bacterium]
RDNVAHFGIEGYFADISGLPADYGFGPATKADRMLAQLKTLGVDPGAALMIGDAIDDAVEAAAAGVPAVLVATGDTSMERLLSSGYRVADSLLAAVRGDWLV